jgi:hypothetical protein
MLQCVVRIVRLVTVSKGEVRHIYQVSGQVIRLKLLSDIWNAENLFIAVY